MRLMPFYHRAPHDRQPLRPLVAPGRPAPDVTGTRRWREVGYAVVDLETTGLSPAADAILEVGVVLTDADGQVERSWSTLIDPGPLTGVGPTAVHGLHTQDLVGAPALDDVADLLVRDLAGRAVVAHNARFDVGFLTQALGGRDMLDVGARVPRVCTMEWARHFMTTPSRRLTACCQAAGVVVGQHHTALDDAYAAAGLLRHYLGVGRRRGEEPVVWARALMEAAVFTGWHWDEERASRGAGILVPRTVRPDGS